MNYLVDLLIQLHTSLGSAGFIAISLVIAILLCWLGIPITTDLMVNNAAGIAGCKFGPHSRTLVINASTNNPELLSMTVSMGSKRMGGWANPLGSLLANVYLMYGVGLLWVYFRFTVTGQKKKRRTLSKLLWQERRLLTWHLVVAFGTFACGLLALKTMQGQRTWPTVTGLTDSTATTELPAVGIEAFIALALLIAGVVLFLLMEKRLKRKRPQLFLEIDDSDHGHSIFGFIVGTVGLIITCAIMNALFLAWSEIYHDQLTAVFGLAVFAGLHYFLGALITSLPELRVATSNYRKLTSADINTALASASYSNFTNLILCTVGLIIFIVLTYCNYIMPWE